MKPSDLAAFVCPAGARGPSEAVLREAKRLLLNQLTASAQMATQPDGQAWLAQAGALAPRPLAGEARARIWWTAWHSTPDAASAINQTLCGMHPEHASHAPSLIALSPGLLPAVLAAAESGGHSGTALLSAYAIGVEVELACALVQAPASAQAWPTGQAEGEPANGRLAAIAALCHLGRLGPAAAGQALRAAMGDDLDRLNRIGAALPRHGQAWRLQSLTLHCRPAPLIAQAPIEAALRLRQKLVAPDVERLTLALSPAAWQRAHAAQAHDTDLDPEQALRHCLATSWLTAHFSADDWQDEVWADADIQSLKTRIHLIRDPALTGVAQCLLRAQQGDGSWHEQAVDSTPGAPDEPLRDSELAELFRQAADDLVLPRRTGEILYAVWGLEQAPSVAHLAGLLQRPA